MWLGPNEGRLGVDHTLVGTVLGKKWQLPGLLGEVIRLHHFSEFDEPVPV